MTGIIQLQIQVGCQHFLYVFNSISLPFARIMTSSATTVELAIGYCENTVPVQDVPRAIRKDTSAPDSSVDIEMCPLSSDLVTPSPLTSEVEAQKPPNSQDINFPLSGPSSGKIPNPYRNRFRVLASCMAAFGNGTNDSAPGALIASIEK